MVNKKQKAEEAVRPTSRSEEVDSPQPEKRKKILSESELSDLEKSMESEIDEDVKGHLGPRPYYTPPQPLLYMPKTHNTDALIHDMETQKLIEDSLKDIENLREQMDNGKLEIERLKSETRMMIARLLMA